MRKPLKSLNNAEYILRMIISNHVDIHSTVLKLMYLLKGTKHTSQSSDRCIILDRLRGKVVCVFVLV